MNRPAGPAQQKHSVSMYSYNITQKSCFHALWMSDPLKWANYSCFCSVQKISVTVTRTYGHNYTVVAGQRQKNLAVCFAFFDSVMKSSSWQRCSKMKNLRQVGSRKRPWKELTFSYTFIIVSVFRKTVLLRTYRCPVFKHPHDHSVGTQIPHHLLVISDFWTLTATQFSIVSLVFADVFLLQFTQTHSWPLSRVNARKMICNSGENIQTTSDLPLSSFGKSFNPNVFFIFLLAIDYAHVGLIFAEISNSSWDIDSSWNYKGGKGDYEPYYLSNQCVSVWSWIFLG